MRKIFNLKKFRKEHNLTQEKFAEILGISQSDVSRYENDPNTLPFYIALNIAHIFNIVSLEDFFNDEIANTPSISMENLYLPFSDRILKYQKKISSFIVNEQEKQNFKAEEIYFGSCFFLESFLLKNNSKPTVSFVDISDNALDRRNMLSNILGSNKIQDFGIPIFYVDKKSRPTWANTNSLPENSRKDFDWLDGDILYFKKPMHLFFDIKLINSIRYSYYSEEDFNDMLLNPKNKEDAVCAVVFIDSDLLQNINILSLSKNMSMQNPAYANIVDIKIIIGTETDLSNIKINENGINSVLRVSVGVKKGQLSDKTICTYHLSSEKDNEPFYTGLKNAISEYFNLLTKNYKKNEKEWFKILKAIYEDSSPKTFIKADESFIRSKMQNLKNDIKDSILNIKNDSVKEFEKIYYEETDTKEIEKKISVLGSETYKELNERKCFPCNKNDLEKTKKTLFEHFMDRISKMLIDKQKENLQKTISIIENYKDEDGFYVLNPYKKGLQSALGSLKNNENNNDSVDDVGNTYLELLGLDSFYPNWEESIEDPIREIFYNKALVSISTFARGFSLSKARKISKALQNFSVFKEFTQVFEDWWNADFSNTEQIVSCIFEESLDTFPRTEEDLDVLKEIQKMQISIIEELQT